MPLRYLFFDLDQTLTPSRQPILPAMRRFLRELKGVSLIIVSGQDTAQISRQIVDLPAYLLGQNGSHALDPAGHELWRFTLSAEQRQEILAHIAELTTRLDAPPNEDYRPIEDRGAQITFSPIGNAAPVELKRIYDPDRRKRERLLADHPFRSRELVVKIGGSTSLDYFHRERHKGAGVARLIDERGWPRKACVYFGDGLYPGGNDEAVIGVIQTIPVRDHLDTYTKLLELYPPTSPANKPGRNQGTVGADLTS